MDKFSIRGSVPLEGEIPVSGAKNAALPVLAACLLTDEPVVLRRIPDVRDIATMKRLLISNGALVEDQGAGCIRVEASDNVLVAKVRVTVLDEGGTVVEAADAVRGEGNWWEFASQARGTTIVAEAWDLPKNVTRFVA